MASWTAGIAAVYLAAVLDYGLAPELAIGRVTPDWFAIAAALAVVAWHGRPPVALAVVAGIAADLHRGGQVGVTVGGMVLAIALVEWLPRRLESRHPALLAGGCGAAAAIVAAWAAVVGTLVGESGWSAAEVFVLPWWRGAYTAAISAPLWMVAGWTAGESGELAISRE